MYEINIFKNDINETTYEFTTRFRFLSILSGMFFEMVLKRPTWTVVVSDIKANQVIY